MKPPNRISKLINRLAIRLSYDALGADVFSFKIKSKRVNLAWSGNINEKTLERVLEALDKTDFTKSTMPKKEKP